MFLLPIELVPFAVVFNCCRIMSALGLTGSVPGPAGGMLFWRLNPQLIQSCVTPIQCPAVPTAIAGLAYSIRIQAPSPPVGRPVWVISPSKGQVVQVL